ncbi:hypothetical protein ACH5BF_04505 [Arcobacter sp. YIC-464]|uniref:hypothetical protein n=1 Tax=Arcobacter sp. YIC-464 TaxID=3376631 RepID=UPI003C22901B
MSFKQAKELVERMEFSELSLRKATKNLEKTSKAFEQSNHFFDETLKKQEEVLHMIPKADKKISLLYLALAVNVGFILGLLVGKFIF